MKLPLPRHMRLRLDRPPDAHLAPWTVAGSQCLKEQLPLQVDVPLNIDVFFASTFADQARRGPKRHAPPPLGSG